MRKFWIVPPSAINPIEYIQPSYNKIFELEVRILGMKSFFRRLFGKKADETPAATSPVANMPVQPEPIANRPQFVAAIASAIAMEMGTDVSGLRIHSIRRVGAADPNRGAFVAAVSAAIATEMGTDVSGLRIHSIRPVAPRASNRGEFVAAIAAALAQQMGKDVNGLRIHSIRQVS